MSDTLVWRHVHVGSDNHLMDKILDPSYLNGVTSQVRGLQKILETSGTSAVAWIGEAGGASNSGRHLVTDAFVSSFWYEKAPDFSVLFRFRESNSQSSEKYHRNWDSVFSWIWRMNIEEWWWFQTKLYRYLDQLGIAASHDTKTHCRQTLIGGGYGLLNSSTFLPNPDFYRSIIKISPGSIYHLRVLPSIQKCFSRFLYRLVSVLYLLVSKSHFCSPGLMKCFISIAF